MTHGFRTWLALTSLTLLGVATHLVPHEMGISTVGAVGMLAAAYLPRSLLVVPVLLTLLVADAVAGFYVVLAMVFVYGGHVAAALAVRPVMRTIGIRPIVTAAVLSACVFYLISNITPMAMGYYPATIDGWLTCYVNGLPFLFRGILANLAFGGVFFGAIWAIREYRAHRFAAPQRN